MSSKLKEIEIIKSLVSPHMTEKAYAESDNLKQFVFKIKKDVNKLDVKLAIEKFFNVKVKSVNTLNVKGKSKSFKQRTGKRKDWKKAYVQLQEGYDLDFIGTAE